MDKKSMRYLNRTTLYNIVGPTIANIEREIERIEIELQQLKDGEKFREKLKAILDEIKSTIIQYQEEIPGDIADVLVDRVLGLKFEIEGYMYVKGNKIAKLIQLQDADKSIKRLRELTGKIEGMTKSEVYGEVQEIVKDIEESTVLSDYEKAERKKAIARLILVILKNEVKKGEKVDLSELRGICDSKDIAHAIRLELIEMAREEKEDNESARKNFLELAQRVNQDEDLGICDPDIWEALTGVRGSVVIGQENKEQEVKEKDNSQSMQIAIYEGNSHRSALDIVKERMRKLLKLDTKCTLAILDKDGNIVGTEVKYTNLKRMPKKYKERLVEVEISAEVVPTMCLDYDEHVYTFANVSLGENSKYLKKIILTDEVKKLESGAFMGLRSLEEVKIGKNIKEIPYFCFAYTGLHELNIPSSVTSLGDSACSCCYGLREVNLEEGIKQIGSYCFRESGLESLTIPDSVEELGECVCYRCSDLKSVNIGAGIAEITKGSFTLCNGLQEIDIPGTVDTIGNGAFSWCENLRKVSIGEGVRKIGMFSFADTGIETIYVPHSVELITPYAFTRCPNLTSAMIGEGVTTIPEGCFRGSGNLESVEYNPEAKIMEDAFKGCEKLDIKRRTGNKESNKESDKESDKESGKESDKESGKESDKESGEESDKTTTGNEDPDDPDDPNRS